MDAFPVREWSYCFYFIMATLSRENVVYYVNRRTMKIASFCHFLISIKWGYFFVASLFCTSISRCFSRVKINIKLSLQFDAVEKEGFLIVYVTNIAGSFVCKCTLSLKLIKKMNSYVFNFYAWLGRFNKSEWWSKDLSKLLYEVMCKIIFHVSNDMLVF